LINELNDVELCAYRASMRDAYERLDILTRECKLDALWIECHRISNAAEKIKERLNRLKYK